MRWNGRVKISFFSVKICSMAEAKRVKLHINGEARSFEKEITVQELIQLLAVRLPAVVVEVNRTIVPKSAYAQHRLEDGDRIEIVTFVGGG